MYGVGVRAGMITPQIEDEKQFRELVGLPGVTEPVVDTWADDGGTRRPITLKSKGEDEQGQLPPADDQEDSK